MKIKGLLLSGLLLLSLAGGAPAAAAPVTGPAFDAAAATRAYLAKMPAAQKARSNAYFEGGYWLILWAFLATAAVSLLLLSTRWSARMRNVAERISGRKPIQTAIYWVQYTLVSALLIFPFTWYQGFRREHQYGLANQTFGPWLGDWAKGIAVSIVFGALAVPILYGVIRRAGRNWWVWGALTAIVFFVFGDLIAPVYIDPLFNKYTRLEDPQVREPILSLARANGIGVSNVYVVDASRQSTRISANVSGVFGTERVTLNDNLLKRCSLEQIEAVMGHEMGHYVLNHVYKGIVFFGVLIVAGFAFVAWSFERVRQRWGARWDVRGLGDAAGLPLLMLLISFYFFVLTPVTNTLVRTMEYEADVFGLNATRQPDGFAEVALKLSDYRKIEPGPVEEWIFFDHPSGHTRIFTAMRWKAEHPDSAR
jgi:STE24 endopeptidase